VLNGESKHVSCCSRMVIPHPGMVIPRSLGSIQRLAAAKGAREDSGWGSWVSADGGFTWVCLVL